MDIKIKEWIENKLKELCKCYCPSAAVNLDFDDNSNSENGARMEFRNYKSADYTKNIFIIRIFPSIQNLNWDKETILRHELMHIKDIRNRNFKFNADVFQTYLGPYIELTWEIAIDERLKAQGYPKVIPIIERLTIFKERHFDKDFRFLEDNDFDLENKLENNQDILKNNSINFDNIRKISKDIFSTYSDLNCQKWKARINNQNRTPKSRF